MLWLTDCALWKMHAASLACWSHWSSTLRQGKPLCTTLARKKQYWPSPGWTKLQLYVVSVWGWTLHPVTVSLSCYRKASWPAGMDLGLTQSPHTTNGWAQTSLVSATSSMAPGGAASALARACRHTPLAVVARVHRLHCGQGTLWYPASLPHGLTRTRLSRTCVPQVPWWGTRKVYQWAQAPLSPPTYPTDCSEIWFLTPWKLLICLLLMYLITIQ